MTQDLILAQDKFLAHQVRQTAEDYLKAYNKMWDVLMEAAPHDDEVMEQETKAEWALYSAILDAIRFGLTLEAKRKAKR